MSDNPFGASFDAPYEPAPKPNRQRTWLIIALVSLGGAVMLVCCGGFGAVVYVGLNMVADDVEAQLAGHPVLVAQLGEIESIEMEIFASMMEDDDDVFVFEVTGLKGRGRLTAKCITGEDGSEIIKQATLRLPSGKEVELVPL